MPPFLDEPDVPKLLSWVYEAQSSHQDWRSQSWEDCEMADGVQWTADEIQKSKAKRIKPITINRTFPVLNYLHGYFLNNKVDITAKGRTKTDTELGQVMTEGLKFVLDQNKGQHQLSRAFKQQITSGFGCLSVGFNSDPREERIQIKPVNWYSIWWDQYATPWMDKNDCRYVFTQDWTDIENLYVLFPEKRKELEEQYSSLASGTNGTDYGVYSNDLITDNIEDYKRSNASWVDEDRNRVNPVEIWYPELVDAAFAIMPSGYAVELTDDLETDEQLRLLTQAVKVVQATVKKMRVTTILENLVLQDMMSPYAHDRYPFVPFVSYLDRFDFPFGVPRQIKEQDKEVNTRRSVGLALLNGRRVKMEKGAVEDVERVYHEANRFDGMIVTKDGKLDKVQIEELTALAPGQMGMLEQSEREIHEISGATGDTLRAQAPSRSGSAFAEQKETTSVMIASLIDNARFSQHLLGELVQSMIQNTWTGRKVMRVTDSVTQAEKFITINEQIEQEYGIEIRNDITQATFDLKVADSPLTDTVREKNMELLFAAINSADKEDTPLLLNLAFELSDIPNKDTLLQPLRQRTGYDPADDQLTALEREAKAKQKAADQRAEQERLQQVAAVDKKLEQDAAQADIELTRAQTAAELATAGAKKQDVDQKGFQIGQQAAQMTRNNVKEDADPKYETRSDESHSN